MDEFNLDGHGFGARDYDDQRVLKESVMKNILIFVALAVGSILLPGCSGLESPPNSNEYAKLIREGGTGYKSNPHTKQFLRQQY